MMSGFMKIGTHSFVFPAGGIIALGVFGGFILLAAIVTSIVLLIRRYEFMTSYGTSFST